MSFLVCFIIFFYTLFQHNFSLLFHLKAAELSEAGEAALKDAAAASGAVKTASGLVYLATTQGSGKTPTAAATVKVVKMFDAWEPREREEEGKGELASTFIAGKKSSERSSNRQGVAGL